MYEAVPRFLNFQETKEVFGFQSNVVLEFLIYMWVKMCKKMFKIFKKLLEMDYQTGPKPFNILFISY